eukprot:gene26368-17462_t
MHDGLITHWGRMERVWERTFEHELKINPTDCKCSDVGGAAVTAHLVDLLKRRGYNFNAARDAELVREVKEKLCYTAVNVDKEMKLASETTCIVMSYTLPDGNNKVGTDRFMLARETTCIMKSYTLPDGRIIKIGTERFMAPESLFTPSLVDQQRPGIADMAFSSINKMSMDNRRCLYENVLVSGGSTMFLGFPTRLQNELGSLYCKHILKGDESKLGSKVKINVSDPPNRANMVFRGGSALGAIMKAKPEIYPSFIQFKTEIYPSFIQVPREYSPLFSKNSMSI